MVNKITSSFIGWGSYIFSPSKGSSEVTPWVYFSGKFHVSKKAIPDAGMAFLKIAV
jgi:hypothetical protein